MFLSIINKKIYLLVLLLTIFSCGCLKEVTRETLFEDIKDRLAEKNTHINILWYCGTKDNFHYLRHVYSMVGTDYYRISKNELNIINTFPLTTDSKQWVQIKQIDNDWHASRKHGDEWEKDEKGITIVQMGDVLK